MTAGCQKCICDDCKHIHSYSVCVGDCSYDNYVDDYECDIDESLWTDEDNILMSRNECRHYEQMEMDEGPNNYWWFGEEDGDDI